MTNMKKIQFLCLLASAFILLMFIGCGNGTNPTDETPTRGNIKIQADESFKLLIETELFTFQSLYKYAHITPSYKSEGDIIADFINDTVRNIIVTRQLTEKETKYLTSIRIIARTTKIAYDGVALIVNKNNTDTTLMYSQLQDILSGKITKWSQINPKSKTGDIILVFDNNKSGNFRLIKEKFMENTAVPENCFAVNSNTEVLNYVKDKSNAIGVIGVNWISDKDDTISHNFMTDIRVMGISAPGAAEGSEYYKPYQAYLADGSYPLKREVYYISRESFAGLGRGFVSFIAGDKGQRIVLKSGLVPATMPVRLVQIRKNFKDM